MGKDVIETFQRAKRASTPLVAISTADQNALTRRLFKANGGKPYVKLVWDIVEGVHGGDDASEQYLDGLGTDRESLRDPVMALQFAAKLDERSLFVMQTMGRFIHIPEVMQAIYNLRDPFSKNFRMLVMLSPSFKLPAELADVVLLDEALPSEEEIVDRLVNMHDHALGTKPPKDVQRAAADAARGLSLFSAEQVFAMSLTKDGLDLDDAWQRKEAAVNQTRGLRFRKGGADLDQLGGLEAAKTFVDQLMGGPQKPGCIVFLDEVEKAIAGAAQGRDSSGVSQDFLGTWLSWMEDHRHDGLIAVGPPGSGKTAFGQSIGATHDIPTITVDVGALKGSLVGESEQALRDALKVIDSVAGEAGAFIFATCNSESDLPPEFKRRFRSGRWFFDLPSNEERDLIWDLHYYRVFPGSDLKRPAVPADHGWTGAEIRNCVELAHKLQIPLGSAATYVVPVAQSDPDSIDKLRSAAKGRWLSASSSGPYRIPPKETPGKKTRSARAVDVGEMN